jgi:hypothetical protein
MWAPLTVLLMILATALGARGAGVAASNGIAKESTKPSVEERALGFERSHAELTPVNASAFLDRAALGNGVFPVVRPALASSYEARDLDDFPLEPIVMTGATGEPTLPGVFSEFPSLGIRAQRDSLPGAAGSPRMLSSFARYELFHDGRWSLEAGVQLPMFDDVPGLPEPEFIVQFRLQF